MVDDRSWGAWRSLALFAGALGLLGLGVLFAASTQLVIQGSWRGLYLLRSERGRPFLLKDDLLLGEHPRLMASVSFGAARRLLSPAPGAAGSGPALTLEWDQRTGSGLVRNRLADGTELLTLFSRYRDSDGLQPHGLFVGGALPEVSADAGAQEQSGMAFQDARGWAHVWCNVNEGLEDELAHAAWTPTRWRYLGSRVLVREPGQVTLESSHELSLAGGLLRVDRFAAFVAGEPFFRLTIRLRNLGPGAVGYTYLYGDEPWVGHFGSAEGNIGWRPGALLRAETPVEPAAGVAGILDERSGLASFIAWSGGEPPDFVYVSNQGGQMASAGQRLPLTSNEIFIGLEWMRRSLGPGQGRTMALALGMARADPATGIPVAPAGALRRAGAPRHAPRTPAGAARPTRGSGRVGRSAPPAACPGAARSARPAPPCAASWPPAPPPAARAPAGSSAAG